MVMLRRREQGEREHIDQQMERFLDRYVGGWKRPLVSFGTGEWQPAIDLYETPESVVIVADLAGLRIDQIEITIDKGALLLKGARPDPPRRAQAQFHIFEINRGSFQRLIRLPMAVDPDGATAAYQDGFLEIVLPKAARNPTTTVKIRTV